MRVRRIPGSFFFAVCFIIGLGMLGLLIFTLHITREQAGVRGQVFMVFGLTTLVLYALLYRLFLRRSNTIRDIRDSVQFFTSGNLQHRIRQPGVWELRDLVYSINSMASELNARMETIRDQRNELAVLFEGMTDGLLAVDLQGRITDINDAMAQWLRLRPEQARGKNLYEITRSPDIRMMVQRMLDKKEGMEMEITLRGAMDRQLDARGSLLKQDEDVTGALIIFRDTTRLRKLEAIRTDFVANVSHELKTPITAIKGYAETLADLGGSDPAAFKKFMPVIVKQSNRLHAIVEDLLSLSRLEQQQDQLQKETMHLRQIIQGAVHSRAALAQGKHTVVEVDCPESLTAPVNESLFEQALANLIENAIKYSPEHTTVKIAATLDKGLATIRITDQGPGITPADKERIFERFYRVDRGRSREMGGTGLGLSIVKHIMLAHEGTIAVESNAQEGTTFILKLPSPQAQPSPLPELSA